MIPPLATSTLDKLREEPTEFWIKILAIVGAIVAVLIGIRIVVKMSKVLLAFILLLLFLGICNWVYMRSEPRMLTPYIDRIAPYFPGSPKILKPVLPLGRPTQ